MKDKEIPINSIWEQMLEVKWKEKKLEIKLVYGVFYPITQSAN